MAKPADIVQLVKWESTAGGGSGADNLPVPSEIEPEEDAINAAGIYGAESGKDGTDKIVALYRESDRWYFEDTDYNGASRKSLADLAAAGAGGITEPQHEALDRLTHRVNETSYDEFTYSGNQLTNLTVWTSAAKTLKIREEQYTYSGNQVTTYVEIQYDGAGVEKERNTESYSYSGNKVSSITRTHA